MANNSLVTREYIKRLLGLSDTMLSNLESLSDFPKPAKENLFRRLEIVEWWNKRDEITNGDELDRQAIKDMFSLKESALKELELCSDYPKQIKEGIWDKKSFISFWNKVQRERIADGSIDLK